MWPKCSETLVPLTDLIRDSDKLSKTKSEKTNKLRKIVWSSKCQLAFDRMKALVAREALLSYPNFKLPFEIYSDASKFQLGVVIVQNNRLLAFFSRKLNSAQRN